MHPADMIFFWANANPEQPALIQADMVLTYRELAEAIEAVSERVGNYGFSAEEPIAVSIPDPLHELIVCFALMRRGTSVAPVHPTALPYLRANGINNVIYKGDGLMLSGGRNIRFEPSWLRRLAKATAGYSVRESLASRANVIFLMPDTAGNSQKMILPAGALLARVRMLPLIGNGNYSVALIIPSINSSLGFSRVALNLYAGKTACFSRDYESQVLLINTFNVDTLVCSTEQAAGLIEFIEKNEKYGFDPLREVWIEGGQATKDLVKKIQSWLCHNVIIGYGSAEAGRICYANYDTIANVPGAVGFVVPNVTVEIVDDKAQPLALGDEGVVRCRTEHYCKVFAANNPQCVSGAAAAWWYPGDRGRLTWDGTLCVTRRKAG